MPYDPQRYAHLRTKQDVIDAICAELGTKPLDTSRGSTGPKTVLLAIHRRFGLRLDPDMTKPQMAQAIAEIAGVPWDPECDSRHTPSRGGSTITLEGLRRLLAAVRKLKDRYG